MALSHWCLTYPVPIAFVAACVPSFFASGCSSFLICTLWLLNNQSLLRDCHNVSVDLLEKGLITDQLLGQVLRFRIRSLSHSHPSCILPGTPNLSPQGSGPVAIFEVSSPPFHSVDRRSHPERGTKRSGLKRVLRSTESPSVSPSRGKESCTPLSHPPVPKLGEPFRSSVSSTGTNVRFRSRQGRFRNRRTVAQLEKGAFQQSRRRSVNSQLFPSFVLPTSVLRKRTYTQRSVPNYPHIKLHDKACTAEGHGSNGESISKCFLPQSSAETPTSTVPEKTDVE